MKSIKHLSTPTNNMDSTTNITSLLSFLSPTLLIAYKKLCHIQLCLFTLDESSIYLNQMEFSKNYSTFDFIKL